MSLAKMLDLAPQLDAAIVGALRGEDTIEEIEIILLEMKSLAKSSRALLPNSTMQVLSTAQGVLNRFRKGTIVAFIETEVEEEDQSLIVRDAAASKE